MEAEGLTMQGQPESRGLTGLRGFGALLVLLHHYYLHVAAPASIQTLSPLLRSGYLGVDLFFVLSGFVMAMVYGRWFTALPSRWPTLAVTFMVRRAARLWPVHVAVLGLTLLLVVHSGGSISGRTMVANVAMIQAWGLSSEVNTPAWSISTEWFAYLVFPLLARLLLGSRLGLLLAPAAIGALLAADMMLGPNIGIERRGAMDIYFNYSLLPEARCLAGIMLGMLAWRLAGRDDVRQVFSRPWAGPAAVLAMLVAMQEGANDLLIYPLLPVIVLGLHFGRGAAWRLFAKGPLYRLGVLSYAFYMVHFAVLSWFPYGWGPPALQFAAYLAETLAAAFVLHWVVEWPGRRIVRRWGEAAARRVLGQVLVPVLPVPLRDSPRSTI